MNRITKGAALVGKLIGTIQAAAGSIGSTELADAAVTSAKMAMTWGTLTNSTKSVSAVTVPAANSGYLITNVGSSKGLVLSGTRLSNPTAGQFYQFNVTTTPSTIPIHIKSTAATFDGTNKYILMNAAGDFVRIEAASATRWVITAINSATVVATT